MLIALSVVKINKRFHMFFRYIHILYNFFLIFHKNLNYNRSLSRHESIVKLCITCRLIHHIVCSHILRFSLLPFHTRQKFSVDSSCEMLPHEKSQCTVLILQHCKCSIHQNFITVFLIFNEWYNFKVSPKSNQSVPSKY